MFKKRFKQYSLIKHSKHVQGLSVAYVKSDTSSTPTLFYTPNRVLNVLYSHLSANIRGYGDNYFTPFKTFPSNCNFLLYKGTLIRGIWLRLFKNLIQTPMQISSVFPHTRFLQTQNKTNKKNLTILKIGFNLKNIPPATD
jgi:hypothetical protein